jgi:hypothetical protein
MCGCSISTLVPPTLIDASSDDETGSDSDSNSPPNLDGTPPRN